MTYDSMDCFDYITANKEVMFSPLCVIVNKIMGKLLDGLLPNLLEECVMGQERIHFGAGLNQGAEQGMFNSHFIFNCKI